MEGILNYTTISTAITSMVTFIVYARKMSTESHNKIMQMEQVIIDKMNEIIELTNTNNNIIQSHVQTINENIININDDLQKLNNSDIILMSKEATPLNASTPVIIATSSFECIDDWTNPATPLTPMPNVIHRVSFDNYLDSMDKTLSIEK
jgi:hypothetical protein